MKFGSRVSKPRTNQRNSVPERGSSLHSASVMVELYEVFTTFKRGGEK